MKKVILIALVLGFASAAQPALAQQGGFTQSPGHYGGSINSQAVTSSVSTQNLPVSVTPYNTLTIVNYGLKDAYVAFGTTANINSIPVRAGKSIHVLIPPGTTKVSVICGGSDTTTVDLIQSSGDVN